ncbi:MAG TPA: dihydrodipicolinate synthase family protein [Ruminococcaceae bacterium]|nr:dihydrodipicolinate synthase family protein [Oscillospiraceae bacterium]
MNILPNGVYPTMLTPFDENGKIDYEDVERLIEFYHKNNTEGIFAVCQSSEMFYLTIDERVELAKFIVDHAPKNMTIIASGHIADTIEQQIEDAKKIAAQGVHSYVFISNKLDPNNDGDDVFKKNAETILNAIPDYTFGIYECPYPYKRIVSPELLKWCAQTGRFSFLKDTCCDSRMIKQKLDAVKGSQLKIYNANSATLLETLKMGASGFSGVMGNFHPDLYVWLCKNYESQPEKAQLVSNFISIFSAIECRMYPKCGKYSLKNKGIFKTDVSRVIKETELPFSFMKEVESLDRCAEYVSGLL